ncbi:MAG: outer membrane beta-barrel protein [Crocinitomicaceae bacterium]|nr:outer membrane beta-barrel protein [Crocinitomicaceae bacterium]
MKLILTVAVICLSLTSFGQERRNRVGLNKYIPINMHLGMKFSANQYFSTFKLEPSGASSATISGSESIGGGGGFFLRYDWDNGLAFQTELNFHFRNGKVRTSHMFTPDTMITVTKDYLTNFNSVTAEIPIYLKYRWELTPTRKGHWKAGSAISVFLGPRIVFGPYSKRSVGRNIFTQIYDQESRLVETEIEGLNTRFTPIASLGVSAGVDYELHSGLLVHASFYRGLTSHSKKAYGYKILDNRLEVGIGIRFK